MAQKDTVWQTHLHAAETSGSVNDQKFFDEVSGEGKKRKSIQWIQAVFLVGVCHLSLFLSPKMKKKKRPARRHAVTDEHITGKRNQTVLRRGDGRSCWLTRDTLTMFESKRSASTLQTYQAASTCDAAGGSEGDSCEARVSALLRNRELLMNVPESLAGAVDSLINTGGWMWMGQRFPTKPCHC